MKVYIVVSGYYAATVGVFKTKESAESYILSQDSTWRHDYDIEEWELEE